MFEPHQMLCWSCEGNPQDLVLCKKCLNIQPFKEENYFDLFQLPHSFDVDIDQVNQGYLALQTLVHPDRYANGSTREKLYASQWSQTVNRAYAILQNPVERAFYMIKMGLGVDENLKECTIHDPELLMEVYETQEKIGTCDDINILQDLSITHKKRLSIMERKLSDSINNKKYEDALNHLNTYQYTLKTLSLLQEKTDQRSATA